MPTRYTKGSELQQFQYEIANEIRRDAKPIADGVFGNNARHPDMASISNQELDAMYMDAYRRNDRKFLTQEAQRDPQQFLAVTDRIGVEDPPVDPSGKPMQPQAQQDALANTLQQAAMQNAAQAQPMASPPPPMAAPMAAPPPAAAPAALPPPAPPTPQLLGPNGQPVTAMASGGIVTQPTLALIGEAGPEAVVPLNDASAPQPGAVLRPTQMPNVQVDPTSPDAFVRSVTPAARYIEAQTGIPASAMVAMAANETGYGKYAAGNNLFGIKGQGPAGGTASRTWEDYGRGPQTITDTFRAYNNATESFNDFVDFLRSNPRYQPLLAQVRPGSAMTAEQFAQGLKDAGYMTDPAYVSKINSLARQWQPIIDQAT